MSADTYLYVLDDASATAFEIWRELDIFTDPPPEVEAEMHRVRCEADRVWIGQGSGPVVDDSTPASVAFVTRLFWSAPVLTRGRAVTALDYMNMRNDSFYGPYVGHFHDGPALDASWPYSRGRSRFFPSRHSTCHRTRVVHGKAGSPRIVTFRSRGVAAARPVKRFFERNMGSRIVALTD